jgi:guanylate kinase
MSKAAYELSFANQFSHVIENRDFATACKEAERIVKQFIEN